MVSDRVSAQRIDLELPIQLPLLSVASLFAVIRKYFKDIDEFEVRYKAMK